MNTLSSAAYAPTVTDVYTDLNGFQQLRGEKDSDLALKKVAQQFESLFISMMMKSMRQANAVFEEDGLFDNQESNFYRDMHDQQLSLTLAHGKGVGIADALYRQMRRDQPGVPAPGSAAQANVQSGLPMGNPHLGLLERGPAQRVGALPGSAPNERVAIADSPADFVEQMLPHARVAAKKLGVNAEVLIAQAALETGWGQKVLADEQGQSSNNLFNIKAGDNWQGEALTRQTLEFNGVAMVREQAKFRRYDSLAESFADYASHIGKSDRYRAALNAGADSAGYVDQLQRAGYATDPNYAEKIKAVYQRVATFKHNAPPTITVSPSGADRT